MITLTTRQKLFLARRAQSVVMAARRAAGRGPDVTVMRRGIRWHLDLREGIDFSIWLLGAFEPRTLAHYLAYLKPGNVVLDVGANVGAHTLHFAQAVQPGGRVVAFEPTDYAFGKLQQNLALNPDLAPLVTVYQAMLVERPGHGAVPSLYSSWPLEPVRGDSHHLHGGRLQRCTQARATSLDEILGSERLERIDLVKLDIDGHECAMLKGATGMLRRFRPPIIMELAPYVLREQGSGIAELVEILAGTGYGLRGIDSGAILPMNADRLEALIPIGGGRNVLAHPA
jgi:FkbM family methyltransferase